MTRQVVLDTETTGLEPQQGHRIIEIGCIELVDRRHTYNRFHHYINPEREVEEGALEVHGISNEDLAHKPLYGEIAAPLLEFLRGAELIIHNAPFDVAFLNAEFARLGAEWGCIDDHCASVVDTLVMARQRHPGQRNGLDALCKRYEIDNAGRELHGALLDAELLADVYRRMTGGQTALGLDTAAAPQATHPGERSAARRTASVPVIRASEADHQAHATRLAEIAEEADCLWLTEPGDPA